MFESMKERYREQGRAEMLTKCMDKFAELHDEYFAQGDFAAAELTVDMVAYLQDDLKGISDQGV